MSVRTIAKQLGVHFTTVSKALHDDPRIPPETIERVKKAATEAGYYTDPRISNLMASLSNRSKKTATFQIGYLVPSLEILRKNKNYFGHYKGIEIQCKKMGYRLEVIPISGQTMEVEVLKKKLMTNQIRSILVSGMEDNPLDKSHWDKFSVVTVGFQCRNFHSASSNHYHSMLEILYRLQDFGYRRIGLAICSGDLSKTNYQFDAAQRLFQDDLPPSQKIAPLYFTGYQFEPGRLDSWIRAEKPEIIIGDTVESGKWIQKKYPEIDFAHLYHNRFYRNYGGIDQGLMEVGSAAVKLLVSNTVSRIKGESEFPQRIIVDAKFVVGKSIRKSKNKKVFPPLEWLMQKSKSNS